MLSDEDVEVAGYVRVRLSGDTDARALVLQAFEDRGLAVDAAVDLPGSELIVLTGWRRARSTIVPSRRSTRSRPIDQILGALDRVEA